MIVSKKQKSSNEKEMRTPTKLKLKLNQNHAMSVLSACDSKIDLMNPQRDLASQQSHKSQEDSNVLSPVKIGKNYSEDEAKSERAQSK